MLGFFANAFRAISVVALVVLAIGVAPTVGKAFAHSRSTTSEATLNQPNADQSCGSFEAWFLDPTCSNKAQVKKAARTKRHLAHYSR
jgi:hypothetical protein